MLSKLLFLMIILYFFLHVIKSWLIFESIKVLKYKNFILFNLHFANKTILSCFFFLFIDLNLLIHAVVTQIFNPLAERVIPIGIPIKEVKAEIETNLVVARSTISKLSI